MGYSLNTTEANQLFDQLLKEYDIYAPKRFPKQGRYSDTDLIRYDKIRTPEEIVFDEKSDYSAKEVLTPITQAIFYFTEDEYRESKSRNKKTLIFLRPCDINAFEHQDKIYLENGYADEFYKRVRENVKFAMMECITGFDTCFCVSMNTNKSDSYSLAVKLDGDKLTFEVKDQDFAEFFSGNDNVDFTPEFIQENEFKVSIPEIPNKEVLNKLKKHSVWDEFNRRCISCGACTAACSTCTCFTTVDKTYSENAKIGERRRVMASCQVAGFDAMAGQKGFRTTAGDRMRYKVLHKIHDYKARFEDFHMCVGCGRCTSHCPKFISFPATIQKVAEACDEIQNV